MGIEMSRAEVAEGIAASAMAGLWYAMPDVIRSRPRRTAVKVAILGVAGGWGALTYARAQDDHHDHEHHEHEGQDDAAAARVRALTSTAPVIDASTLDLADDDELVGRAVLRTAGIAALAAAGVVVSVLGTAAAERGIFRLGERWRRQGLSGAHTRLGVVAAVVTAGLTVAGAELERRATDPA